VFEGPVVILAEHAKDEMDASVSGAGPRLPPVLFSTAPCALVVCTSDRAAAACLSVRTDPPCLAASPCGRASWVLSTCCGGAHVGHGVHAQALWRGTGT
jgi:hypothetical protein